MDENTQQINNFNNIPSELNPKRQAVFDRLKKRMNLYRKRQNESEPRFDQTFSGICEQQSVETNVLQKRFVESKAKRVAKKADKKSDVNVTQTKIPGNKRPADPENEDAPPVKMPSSSTIDNMKFQVEIVHEFTTSVANLQPQQISTNVTVKANLATASGNLKYEPQDVKGMKIEQPAPPDILQDFKQEPDNEFADLDFGGLANFMANDENELKKLFSNISEVFDQDLFDQDRVKQEPRPPPNVPVINQQNINHLNHQQFNQWQQECQMQKPIFQQQSEMSPAAQTLKNMAQQHQVKNSMAMSYMRPNIGQPIMQQQQNNQQRMPYQPQQQFNDYSNQFQKSQMPFPADMIKQEILMQQPIHQMKPIMGHQMIPEDVKNVVPQHHSYQQNYQNAQFNHQNHQRNAFNSNQNPNMINIAMKQQFNGTMSSGGSIHIQGGQHISGRMGEFSMQQQQQMYFNQYNNHHSNSEGPTSNFNLMQNQSMSFTQQ